MVEYLLEVLEVMEISISNKREGIVKGAILVSLAEIMSVMGLLGRKRIHAMFCQKESKVDNVIASLV